MEQRHNIILFGAENTGKTSTLMALAALLAGINSTHSAWDSTKNRLINKGKILVDARFVIKYKRKLIFIATAGDNWGVCKVNYDFFMGKISGNADVYGIDDKGVYKIGNKEKKEIMNMPDISISACRPEGDRRGAIKSIHSYSEDVLDQFARQIWIRIESYKQNPDMNCWEQAKKIKSIIDDLLKL